MAHFISAIVGKLPIDKTKAKAYDLPVFEEGDFVIVGLYPSHTDYWSEKLGFDHGDSEELLMDMPCVHFFAEELGLSQFAIIFTDYFGGVGEQGAVVYEDGKRLSVKKTHPINWALNRLGVKRIDKQDEFDTVGLGKYRNFDDYF